MSGRGWRVDERIAHTVAFILRCPGLLVPEAMRVCKFTLEESGNTAKQMAVHRSFVAKATNGKLRAPPNIINKLTVGTTTVSSLTNQTSTVRGQGTSSLPSMPKTPTTLMEPPMVDMWTADDEEQLLKISNKEIDMLETSLGWFILIQNRTAVAAVLDFTNKEWESLKALNKADAAERNQAAMSNDIDDIIGASGTENETTGGTIDKGAV
jgi:hypothetical protein